MRRVTACISELTAGLLPGKPFEAFTHGVFYDMSGQRVEVTPEQLTVIVDNTRQAIERTHGLGLPIDPRGHDHEADAAGWVKGVELVGEVIRLIPEWTALGIELVSKSLQRLFSVTLDLDSLTIIGGSLTNWPAVEGLRPVELSRGSRLYSLGAPADGESFDDYTSRVRMAFHAAMRAEAPLGEAAECWVRGVFEDYLLVEYAGGLHKVTFTESDGELTFAALNEWQPQRLVPVDMTRQPATTAKSMEVPMTEEEKKEIAELVAAELRAAPPAPVPVVDLTAAGAPERLTQMLGLNGGAITAEMSAEFRRAWEAEYAQMRAEAERLAREQVQAMQRQAHIADFTQRVTDGTAGAGHGIPTDKARLQKFLGGLSEAQRAEAEGILSEIVRAGLVDFTTRGHGHDARKLRALPAPIAQELARRGATRGEIVAEFSQALMASELEAPINEYDLSAFPAGKQEAR